MYGRGKKHGLWEGGSGDDGQGVLVTSYLGEAFDGGTAPDVMPRTEAAGEIVNFVICESILYILLPTGGKTMRSNKDVYFRKEQQIGRSSPYLLF